MPHSSWARRRSTRAFCAFKIRDFVGKLHDGITDSLGRFSSRFRTPTMVPGDVFASATLNELQGPLDDLSDGTGARPGGDATDDVAPADKVVSAVSPTCPTLWRCSRACPNAHTTKHRRKRLLHIQPSQKLSAPLLLSTLTLETLSVSQNGRNNGSRRRCRCLQQSGLMTEFIRITTMGLPRWCPHRSLRCRGGKHGAGARESQDF
jgi:hypothetical protein